MNASQLFTTAHALTRLILAKDGHADYRSTFGACLKEARDLTGAWVRRVMVLPARGEARARGYKPSAPVADWKTVVVAIQAQHKAKAAAAKAAAAKAETQSRPALSGEAKAQAIISAVRSAGNIRAQRRWTKHGHDRLYVTAGRFQAAHRTITLIIDLASGDVAVDYMNTNRRFRDWAEALESKISDI